MNGHQMNGQNLMTGSLQDGSRIWAEKVLWKWFTVKLGSFLTGHSCQEHRAAIEGTPQTEFSLRNFWSNPWTAGGFSYHLQRFISQWKNMKQSTADHSPVSWLSRSPIAMDHVVGFPSQTNGSFPMLTWFEIVRSLMNHFISNHESSSSWWKKDGFLCVSLFQEKKIWSPVTPVSAPRPRGPVILVSWQHDGNMADGSRPFMP